MANDWTTVMSKKTRKMMKTRKTMKKATAAKKRKSAPSDSHKERHWMPPHITADLDVCCENIPGADGKEKWYSNVEKAAFSDPTTCAGCNVVLTSQGNMNSAGHKLCCYLENVCPLFCRKCFQDRIRQWLDHLDQPANWALIKRYIGTIRNFREALRWSNLDQLWDEKMAFFEMLCKQ